MIQLPSFTTSIVYAVSEAPEDPVALVRRVKAQMDDAGSRTAKLSFWYRFKDVPGFEGAFNREVSELGLCATLNSTGQTVTLTVCAPRDAAKTQPNSCVVS